MGERPSIRDTHEAEGSNGVALLMASHARESAALWRHTKPPKRVEASAETPVTPVTPVTQAHSSPLYNSNRGDLRGVGEPGLLERPGDGGPRRVPRSASPHDAV